MIICLLLGASHLLACLEETSENSPGFQTWERVDMRTSSPEGTAEIARLHRVSTKTEILPRRLVQKIKSLAVGVSSISFEAHLHSVTAEQHADCSQTSEGKSGRFGNDSNVDGAPETRAILIQEKCPRRPIAV